MAIMAIMVTVAATCIIRNKSLSQLAKALTVIKRVLLTLSLAA